MDRAPSRPINFLDDGLRPGAAHQISGIWASARPIDFSLVAPAWPGPDHGPMTSPAMKAYFAACQGVRVLSRDLFG